MYLCSCREVKCDYSLLQTQYLLLDRFSKEVKLMHLTFWTFTYNNFHSSGYSL